MQTRRAEHLARRTDLIASRLRAAAMGALLGMLAGCGGFPARDADPVQQVASPNHDERRPNFVIIHQTSNDTAERALKTLTDPLRRVSAHYLIGRDGSLYQLVSEDRRAWHAGASYWGGTTDLNSASIGIELDNNGDEPFAEAQIVRLLGLLTSLKDRYQIPPANFLGHGDVAPSRKVDPSRHFPWQRLAGAGFGLWCEQPESGTFDALPEINLALQAFGYDLADPARALAAFRRHYRGVDSDAAASDEDRRLLLCLLNARARNGRTPATSPTPSPAGPD
jgi:N-acetylmuramoyl-L-alanine amidase